VYHSLSQYPHWFVVVCTVFVAALVLWLVLKLIKVTLYLVLFGALFAACATLVWMFLR
jgi:hypothetical protein